MKSLIEKYLNVNLIIPVLIGIALGWFIYGVINFQMHQWHYKALANVKASDVIIDAEDVALRSMLGYGASSNGLTQVEDMTYRVSKSFGLIKPDDDYDKISALVKKGFNGNKELLLSPEKLNGTTASQLIIRMLSEMGAEPGFKNSKESEAESSLVRLIGKLPQSLFNYDQILRDSSYENANNKGYFFSYFNPFIPSPNFTNQDINQRLLTQYRLSESFIPVNTPSGASKLKVEGSLEAEVEYKQTKELLNRLIFNWLTASEVSYTKDWIMVFRGPMQLLMFILFFTAILILFLPVEKYIEPSSDDFEEQRSEVFIFCEETMPVLGFIGTIMGLMLALGDAYKIPIASAGTGSALAISSITNTLAMAFTTTLMAFILKIILDLIKLFSSTRFDFVTKRETNLIESLASKINFSKKSNE